MLMITTVVGRPGITLRLLARVHSQFRARLGLAQRWLEVAGPKTRCPALGRPRRAVGRETLLGHAPVSSAKGVHRLHVVAFRGIRLQRKLLRSVREAVFQPAQGALRPSPHSALGVRARVGRHPWEAPPSCR